MEVRLVKINLKRQDWQVCHSYRVNAKWVGGCENTWYNRIHGQELGP